MGSWELPLKAHKNVCLATLSQYFQMVVLEDSGIKSVADLKGKGFVRAERRYWQNAGPQVLQIYGLSYKDMTKVNHVSYADAVSLMKDGHAEGYLLGTTIPASSIMDLAASKKIRLLSLPDDKIKELQRSMRVTQRVIPSGATRRHNH
jgi:TRAP transporter TAXI family solute receptor